MFDCFVQSNKNVCFVQSNLNHLNEIFVVLIKLENYFKRLTLGINIYIYFDRIYRDIVNIVLSAKHSLFI